MSILNTIKWFFWLNWSIVLNQIKHYPHGYDIHM